MLMKWPYISKQLPSQGLVGGGPSSNICCRQPLTTDVSDGQAGHSSCAYPSGEQILAMNPACALCEGS